MKYKVVLFLQLIVFISKGQNNKPVRFSCSFLDDSSGVFIPTKIFFSKNESVDFDEHKKNLTRIDLELNTNDSLLYLYCLGLKSIIVPINYHGKFNKDSYVNLLLSVSKSKNSINDNFIVIYSMPIDFLKSNKYEVKHFFNDQVHCIQNITPFIKNLEGFTVTNSKEHSKNSSFQLLITTAEGKKLVSTKYFFKKGLNIVDLNLYSEGDVQKEIKKEIDNFIINPLENTRNIYFDQSKFDIKESYFSTLDSITHYLKFNLKSNISIAGFTENIGDKKLNSKLAESRSLAVLNYLLKNGIERKRINVILERNQTISHEINVKQQPELRKVIISENK